MYSEESCIEMPDNFPEPELKEFMQEARRVLISGTEKSPAWKEFAGASNLISYRFRASSESWGGYKKLFSTVEPKDRGHEFIYQQELNLFTLFTAGVSCIEATIYSIAAAFSHPNVCDISFDTNKQRQCNVKALCEWLQPYNKAAELLSTLEDLKGSDEWELWVDLRNRMTHRSNLPRIIYASCGGAPQANEALNYAATSSTPQINSDFDEWDKLNEWLATTLKKILVSSATVLKASSS